MRRQQNGFMNIYWQSHIRRERILLDQKKFEAIGYPDDYHIEDWGFERLTGT